MRVFIYLLIILLTGCNGEEKKPDAAKTLAESRNSAELNMAIETSLVSYDSLADAFVRWDSASIPALASHLHQKLMVLATRAANQELATSIGLAGNEAKFIEGFGSLEDKRHSLNSLTDHLFQYLKSVQYDRREIFLQECPMAFHDTGTGIWISGADTIKNPYLGLHHPKYGKGMLKCGENKDKINFTGRRDDEKEVD